ncbi:cytochrome b [Solimonas marina]|uniref:Cytochrome b n=1 Tax=Solimonas marina TaxID=2714601 RepID=A0A969WCD6_9GAMM|nr:cytochrome b [Solimonas marina]NKF24617.1 cytochrome b [Solimonas marina]
MNQSNASHFSRIARALHWTMAALIVLMLLLGAGMIAGDPAQYSRYIVWHKSIGVAIFMLAIVRLLYRLRHPAPALPDDLSALQRLAAHGSHVALYGLMLALPLVGWAMLSAGGYPVALLGGLQLPAILAPHAPTYAALRMLHSVLAWSLFALVMLHLAAALHHGWVRRDGVLATMARWRG